MGMDSALNSIIERITNTQIWKSIVRHGFPNTPRSQSEVMFWNLFLHIQPEKVHKNTLRTSYTLGLGLISFYLFLIVTVTGILLMFFYVPSIERAYRDMKDLEYVVSYGLFMRNMHRWAAHGMVLAVLLHMARVFYTGSYKPPREFNWVVGVVLLVVTLFLSFTGYLLPWDQLAFWAITVGTSIASYAPLLGEKIRFLLLGGTTIGQSALLRFYVLHVMVLPIAASVLIALHFWRIRKDGGLSHPNSGEKGPVDILSVPANPDKTYGLMELVEGTSLMVDEEPEDWVQSWPHLIYREFLLFIGLVILLSAVSIFFNAPLEELANPDHPPNPAKAPWYFLGLQEMVSYSALVGGVIVPGIVIIGLMSIPYIDSRVEGIGIWFYSKRGRVLAIFSAIITSIIVPILIYLNTKMGLRTIYPMAPQFLVDILNPATVLVIIMAVLFFITQKITSSTREASIALFSSFLMAFTELTIIGTLFRGQNWNWIWPWG